MQPHEDRDQRRRFEVAKNRDDLFNHNVSEAIKALLGLPAGRDLLWWLLESSGIGRNPFTSNALSTAFQCGELNSGQKLLARILEVDPDGYLTMLKERNNVNRTHPNADRAGSADPNASGDASGDTPG